MHRKKIILASASPRRAQLLTMLGLTFQIIPSEIDESFSEYETLEENLRALTEKKATFVLQNHSIDNALILAADTIVVLEKRVLAKPQNFSEAFEMLSTLSGKTHTVYTALYLLNTANNHALHHIEKTDVTFCTLTPQEIRRYLSFGEWVDKAGAYAIQGLGSIFIEKINGCFYNVMGLPLFTLCKMIKSFELDILDPK